jgi:hypothetical protein
MTRKLWAIALAVWLLLYGIFALTNLQVQFATFIMGVLAIVAAVLLALDR